jgi:hypothetical protein
VDRVPRRWFRRATRFASARSVSPAVTPRAQRGPPGVGGDRLTFLGDAGFQDHFDRPDWYNAFDHDPEEAVRVRVGLLRELATAREPLVAAHVSFPYGRVAVAGDVFRWIPTMWEY